MARLREFPGLAPLVGFGAKPQRPHDKKKKQEPAGAKRRSRFRPGCLKPDSRFRPGCLKPDTWFRPGCLKPDSRFRSGFLKPDSRFRPGFLKPESRFRPGCLKPESRFRPGCLKPESRFCRWHGNARWRSYSGGRVAVSHKAQGFWNLVFGQEGSGARQRNEASPGLEPSRSAKGALSEPVSSPRRRGDCRFLLFYLRNGDVGALPQTPQWALPLDPTRDFAP